RHTAAADFDRVEVEQWLGSRHSRPPARSEESRTFLRRKAERIRQEGDSVLARGRAHATLEVADRPRAETSPRRQLLLGETGRLAVATEQIGEKEGFAARAHNRTALGGLCRPCLRRSHDHPPAPTAPP